MPVTGETSPLIQKAIQQARSQPQSPRIVTYRRPPAGSEEGPKHGTEETWSPASKKRRLRGNRPKEEDSEDEMLILQKTIVQKPKLSEPFVEAPSYPSSHSRPSAYEDQATPLPYSGQLPEGLQRRHTKPFNRSIIEEELGHDTTKRTRPKGHNDGTKGAGRRPAQASPSKLYPSPTSPNTKVHVNNGGKRALQRVRPVPEYSGGFNIVNRSTPKLERGAHHDGDTEVEFFEVHQKIKSEEPDFSEQTFQAYTPSETPLLSFLPPIVHFLKRDCRPPVPDSLLASTRKIFENLGVQTRDDLLVLAHADEALDLWLGNARAAGLSVLWESIIRVALRRLQGHNKSVVPS